MRMSCNGCRVLRKGCSDACTIRPCLQWIDTPEAQANATVFLAKFYGRAGLLNLLAAAPDDAARPAVFRSLLYEACGRIVNPVYGSVGLLWSRQWQKCVDAVDAVLKGRPVVQVDAASDAAAAPPLLGGGAGARSAAAPAAAYDIRHVAKDPDAVAAADLLRVARGGRKRFKRAGSSSSNASKAKPLKGKTGDTERASPSPQQQEAEELEPVPMVGELEHGEESAGSHDHHHMQLQGSSEDTDVEAASHVTQAEAEPPVSSQSQSQSQVLVADQEEEEVGLELTLGFEPVPVVRQQPRSSCCDRSGLSAASSLIALRLQLPAT
ncbi:LOB domain-containing protein 42-like [Miscanthus floridulus]|uniref:LOB domain-containing protein 42-like n=1 Tax=Miscanthus floridulus TaxID=154761 RepID=UPI00345A184B